MIHSLITFDEVYETIINKLSNDTTVINLKPWDIITIPLLDIQQCDEIATVLGATYKKNFYCDGDEHKELFSISYFKNRDTIKDCYSEVMKYHIIMDTITYCRDRRVHMDIAHDKNHCGFIKLK